MPLNRRLDLATYSTTFRTQAGNLRQRYRISRTDSSICVRIGHRCIHHSWLRRPLERKHELSQLQYCRASVRFPQYLLGSSIAPCMTELTVGSWATMASLIASAFRRRLRLFPSSFRRFWPCAVESRSTKTVERTFILELGWVCG